MTEDRLLAPDGFPDGFRNDEDLEEFMSRPSQALVDDLAAVEGDIMVLGVGGKMGPTLARLAKRAAPHKRVIGVARFSEASLAEQLAGWGVEAVRCDLMDAADLARLPAVDNVIFMAGRKFGSTGSEALTWAANVLLPAQVAEHFKDSRIVAFSTACVYPFTSVLHQGPRESEPPIAPPGEYAWSCVGRERVFEYHSRRHGTPGRLIRLSYAIDTRYGVLHDIASKVVAGKQIDISTGHANIIWQGDANAMVLRTLRHCTAPTTPLNVTGPEVVSLRAVAAAMGQRLGVAPVIEGEEQPTAWLAHAGEAFRLFGYPMVTLDRMVDWVCDWVAAGKAGLGKPTGFEVRDGRF